MKKKILIVGADRVMPKLFYFQDNLNEIGYEYEIYTHDNSEFGEEVLGNYNVTAHMAPPHARSFTRLLKDGITFFKLLRHRNFSHIELFSDYHVIASFMYWLTARLMGKKIVLWCRGELYEWSDLPIWQRLYFKIVLNFSDAVILKELYMRQVLVDARITRDENVIDLHNSVLVTPNRPEIQNDGQNVILFLNMFKDWRNVNFCVEIAKDLVGRGVRFRFDIVGEKDDDIGLQQNARELRRKIAAEGLDDLVRVYPFTTKPEKYYSRSKIFVLPADLVYCNYALLEAMASGLVPLAYDLDPGTGLIIEHGVSGFCLPLQPECWGDIIERLLTDDAEFNCFSRAAHTKVREEYSLDVCFNRYVEAADLDLQ